MAAAAELTRLVPTSVQYPRLLAIVTRSYANNLADRTAGSYRNLDEALIHIRRAMEIDQAIHEKDASNRSAFADYIRAVGAVGRVHSLRDEWEPSAKFFDQARLMMEGLFKQFPQDTRLADDTAYNTLELAMSLSNLKRYDEAITMLDRSQAIYEGLLAKDSNNRFARFNRALAVRKSGEIDALRGNPAAGRRKIEEVLKVFEDLNRLDPTMKMYSAQIEMTLKSLANLDKQ
jgi:tetratricopeptide (TPR) repeat protein